MLEDLVIKPAMTKEYMKESMGGEYWRDNMGGIMVAWKDWRLEEMTKNLVCYYVKGMKEKKLERSVKATVPIKDSWRGRTGFWLRETVFGELCLAKIGKDINSALRKSFLDSFFPAESGKRLKAERSIRQFDNNMRLTVKHSGDLRGWVPVKLLSQEDDGSVHIKDFWLTFSGESKPQRRMCNDYEAWIEEGETEMVFQITYINCTNKWYCNIDMPSYERTI